MLPLSHVDHGNFCRSSVWVTPVFVLHSIHWCRDGSLPHHCQKFARFRIFKCFVTRCTTRPFIFSSRRAYIFEHMHLSSDEWIYLLSTPWSPTRIGAALYNRTSNLERERDTQQCVVLSSLSLSTTVGMKIPLPFPLSIRFTLKL